MPALSPTMKKGNLLKWNFKVGDELKAGDALCEIETDKASLSFELQDDGYLAKILIAEGTKDIDIGTPVAILVNKKGDVAALANWTPEASATQAPPQSSSSGTSSSSGHDNYKGAHRSNVSSNSESVSGSTQTQAGASQGSQASTPAVNLPKFNKINMPALSPTMTSGKIIKWQKKVGDKLNPDDVLADVETDKATIDFVFQDEGYLAKFLVQEGGGDIQVGKPVAIIVDKKEDIEKFANVSAEQILGGGAPSPQTIQTQQTQRFGERIFASPLARQTAGSMGVDLSQVQGSGPSGRILKHDVQEQGNKAQQRTEHPSAQTIQQQASREEKKVDQGKKVEKGVVGVNSYIDEPVTSMREVIARRLLESKTTVPHYYLESEIVMDKVTALREKLNGIKDAKTKISFNDIFIKAAALALIDVPEVNSQWHGTYIRKFKNADISVAVDTGKGLITPIVFNANSKGFNEISLNVKDLADRAKKNALKPDEFIGGTFSISNLGMMGVSSFAAVINPPQACILAIGKTDSKLVKEGDSIKSINVMRVVLSCDHRVVDGAVGAKWLQRFKGYLEVPETMLL